MSENNFGLPGNEGLAHKRVHAAPGQRPYWKRAHLDWRMWVGLFFCLAAIIIFIMSEDLSFFPHGLGR
jgi:hypothetical protein